MKKMFCILVCLILLNCSGLFASAKDYQLNGGTAVDLSGEKQNVYSLYIMDFNAKEDEAAELINERIYDLTDEIRSKADEGDFIIINDFSTDNKDNPYIDIEPMTVLIKTLDKSGVPDVLGKDYRLYYINRDTEAAEDVTDSIVRSSESQVLFTADKLGTYALYFNPAVYGALWYSDDPVYDDELNLENPECVYCELNDMKRGEKIVFPEIPQKDGYIFTGWKTKSGNGRYYTEPQPHYIGQYGTYYASWCSEEEYTPLEITLSADEEIIKGEEDGKAITLSLSEGAFIDEIPEKWREDYDSETEEEVKEGILQEWKGYWNIVGNDDLLIETAERIDDKTVKLTLSGNSSDKYLSTDIRIEFDRGLYSQYDQTNGDIAEVYDLKLDKDGVVSQKFLSDGAVTLKGQPRRTGGGSLGGQNTVKKTYVIEFETNGGSPIEKQSINQNAVLVKPENPSKEGYTFKGWYKDSDLTDEYDFSSKVTNGFTLYAAWEENNEEDKDNDSKNKIILTIGQKEASVWGEKKQNDVAPLIRNERTMLPSRFVAESLGAKTEWDGTEPGVVTITKEDIEIIIYIGEDYAKVNGEDVKLDAPAFIENDRTYTPIRFISEKLGASVEWDDENKTVTIVK